MTDDDRSDLRTCRFCGLNFGDHENSCPHGGVQDDPGARGRHEDQVYRDLREREEWGP